MWQQQDWLISNIGKIGAVVGVQAGMALDLVTCGMITRGLTVRVTLQQCHYHNQRYSRGELIGSEHMGTLTQWLSSEIKLRGAYCIR